MRLDLYLVQNGFASGRDRAKELISKGNVKVNGKVCLKPSQETDGLEINVTMPEENFVGRGAYKLKKAFESFCINVEGKLCLDAGASTGGFTEFMLIKGARRVYAVDVGVGQLAEKLLADERVENLEKTDIRSLELLEKASFFSADVSFISLKQILPALKNLTDERAEGVCLIKPQFEAGRSFVGKNGVVKDKKAHIFVINDIVRAAEEEGFFVKGLDHSPITGQNGNIEYLLHISKLSESILYDAEKTVKKAWEELS